MNNYDMKRLVDALENGAKALTALAYEAKRTNDFNYGPGRVATTPSPSSSIQPTRQGWGQNEGRSK